MAYIKCPVCNKDVDKTKYEDMLRHEINKGIEPLIKKNENVYNVNESTNVYADIDTVTKLDQDAIDFGFSRKAKDGTVIPIRNAFISAIMLNYYDEFNLEKEQKTNVIKNTLKHYLPLLTDASVNALSPFIVGEIDTSIGKKIKNKKKIIKVKQTRENEYIYSDIKNEYSLNNSFSSVSDFFYSMFKSYLGHPQYIREQIIFKKKFKAIKKYIQNGNTILIKYKADKNYTNFYPYKLIHSPEENHNYVLGVVKTEDKHNPGQIITLCISYRLDNIGNIIKLSKDPIQMTEEQQQALEESILYCPSSAQQKPGEHTIVALTENGVSLLEIIYTFKPTYIDKVDQIGEYSIYKVLGSSFQIHNYFKRFGADAIILNDEKFSEDQQKMANKIIENYRSIRKDLENKYNQ